MSGIWQLSPKNVKFFNFFPFGSKSTQVKGGSASHLLRVKSKLGSGQGPSLRPDHRNYYVALADGGTLIRGLIMH